MFSLVFFFEYLAFMVFCWCKPKYRDIGLSLEMPEELMGILLEGLMNSFFSLLNFCIV